MKTASFSRLSALTTALVVTSAATAQAAPTRSSVPADMVGKWRWMTISGSNYQDTTTGRIEGGGGMSTTFTFTKDGRYKFFFYVKLRTYSLVTEASTTSEGTVVFSNGKFVLRPTKGHYMGWYNGNKKTDRDMTAAERQKNTEYLWKWTEQNGKRVLMIGPTPNSLSQFKREG